MNKKWESQGILAARSSHKRNTLGLISGWAESDWTTVCFIPAVSVHQAV